jgi:2-amino-4-hydroxy-6-hydroxymethyldihydropteridine diphosphokinase
MSVCLIGLGSNQGERQATLEAAIAELRQNSRITISAVSTWHETEPIGGPSGQSRFLNGVVKAETALDPHELLAFLRQIENHLGRRRTERWASRTIDLDLLLYDELVLSTPTLVLPHPRMAWRRFVLEPAAEVAGHMLHPTTRWTIARLLEHLHHAPPYIAITGAIAAGKTQLAERLAEAISARLIREQPDWAGLDEFYADPAGHAWQIELTFLHQRVHLLDLSTMQNPRQQDNTSGWIVSDFWFDQSAAFAKAWLSEKQRSLYLEQFEQLRRDVMRPKLIVHLDLPPDRLIARVRHRGRACERLLTEEQLGRIRQAVLEQVDGSDVGPVLHAVGDDPEAIFTEVLAAVRGME